MGFVKAQLLVESGVPIIVQFNPKEYNVTNGVKYAEKSIPGQESSILQFVAGETPTLNMTLLFDTYIPPSIDIPIEMGVDVSLLTRRVVKLTHIKGTLHRPPIVTFIWGSIVFQGVVTNVRQQFTMFLTTRIPDRAKLEVTFKSVNQDELLRFLSPLESPDRTKYRTVKEGDQLWNFAQEEYGSPEMWRLIAKANHIMNPLDIYPGQVIKLPAIEA